MNIKFKINRVIWCLIWFVLFVFVIFVLVLVNKYFKSRCMLKFVFLLGMEVWYYYVWFLKRKEKYFLKEFFYSVI